MGASARGRLSRDLVLDAARRVAEEEGVDAVGIRRVARELGVRPNALYTHVRDRDDLLGALADAVLAGVRAPRRGGQRWDVALRRALRAQRDLLLEQPGLAPVLAAPPAGGGTNLARQDAHLLALLAEGGITGAEAAQALRTLRAFVAGWALGEREAPDAAAFEVGLRWLVLGLQAGTAHGSPPE